MIKYNRVRRSTVDTWTLRVTAHEDAGTQPVPIDFLGFAEPTEDLPTIDGNGSTHDVLVSNLLAQRRVLAFGRPAEELAADSVPAELIPHKVMPGNRPSTTILTPKLTPSTLGQLIALYEHQTFTEGVLSKIDSFDQWGVELGKTQALELQTVLSDSEQAAQPMDSSTETVAGWYRSIRGRF